MPDHDRSSRRSIRIPDFSYRAAGAYYVTLCCALPNPLFGEVRDGQMHLNRAGRIVDTAWTKLAQRWEDVRIDDWHVVMPNHFHGIVIINDVPRLTRPPRLGDIIGRFKANTTSAIRKECLEFELQVWQRNYHEHVVRDEADLNRIRQYIENNPAQWTEDEYYGLR